MRARPDRGTRQVEPRQARSRGIKLGWQVGQRPSDKKARKVLALHKEGLSYWLLGRNVGLSKNT